MLLIWKKIMELVMAVVGLIIGLFIGWMATRHSIKRLKSEIDLYVDLNAGQLVEYKNALKKLDAKNEETFHYIDSCHDLILQTLVTEIRALGMVNIPKMELEAARIILSYHMLMVVGKTKGKAITTLMRDCDDMAMVFRDVMDQYLNAEEEPTEHIEFICNGLRFNLNEICGSIMKTIQGLHNSNKTILEKIPE